MIKYNFNWMKILGMTIIIIGGLNTILGLVFLIPYFDVPLRLSLAMIFGGVLVFFIGQVFAIWGIHDSMFKKKWQLKNYK